MARDEITKLVKSGRLRNRLLAASALRTELRSAAERVMRLSESGTPERLLTLVEVADETGLSANGIVDAIVQLKKAAPNCPLCGSHNRDIRRPFGQDTNSGAQWCDNAWHQEGELND